MKPGKIGNKNTDEFELVCCLCGIESHLHQFAFRNRHGEIKGYVFACDVCKSEVGNYVVDIKEVE